MSNVSPSPKTGRQPSGATKRPDASASNKPTSNIPTSDAAAPDVSASGAPTSAPPYARAYVPGTPDAEVAELIGLFGSRRNDAFAARYHLTRRNKLKRLWQIARIANQFDVIHGLTPVKMRLMLEALGPTFVKVGQILSMRSEITLR